MNGKYIRFHAEIVNGQCPTCHEMTILVGLTKEVFRCISCGADLKQHVNGRISYIPTLCPTAVKSDLDNFFGLNDGKS